jgi:hypothetical protein
VLLAGAFDGDLIAVPFVSGTGRTPPDPVGEVLAELQGPLPHGLMTDNDAARGQHLLDMRKLSGKRKYSQTAWLITSGGKREPA